VLIAGDPERAARVARERDGIVVDDNSWAAIVEAGRKVGCAVDH
jgi:hydroxycarboxylate dehydrogenase B